MLSKESSCSTPTFLDIHGSPTHAGYRSSLPTPASGDASTPIFFGDVDNYEAYCRQVLTPDLLESGLVREAHEVCLWLKAAGFPQYVQMFEDGQFPINLTKFQVEGDHAFLEQSAIDALIRRLNILNRCADLMDEIRAKNKDYSGDEPSMRALSTQWTFKRKAKKWLRKTKKQLPKKSRTSSDREIPLAVASPPPPPMLVSELRGSLSDLSRSIKTYSFLPSEDFLLFLDGHSLADVAADDGPPQLPLASSPNMHHAHTFSMDSDSFEEPPLSGTVDNFASCILNTLESNIQKIHLDDECSHSMPDVFSASHMCNGVSSTDSCGSMSSSSLTNSSKEGLCEDPLPTSPFIAVNGHPVLDAGSLVHPVETERGFSSFEDSGTYDRLSAREGGLEGEDEVSSLERRVEKGSVASSAGEVPTYPEGASKRIREGEEGEGGTLPRETGNEPQESSLRRSKSGKWHSFQRAHSFRQAFRPVRTLIPIEELSVGQISVLKKFSLVKLTALLELHKAKANVARILKNKKQKLPDYKNKRVFGVPLAVNVQRIGQPLPQTILYAMRQLKKTGIETTGLFRRAASKAKVEALKEVNEMNPDNTNYDDVSAYDIADMLKLYFRDLPEPLLTNRFSEILIVIRDSIPEQLQLQALQAVILLMPDENREAFQALLELLREVADHSHINQMDAYNLAVCFAPTIFSLAPSRPGPVRKGSFKRNTVNHSANNLTTSKDVLDSVACSQCLAQMIKNCDKLFMVAADMMQLCNFTHLEFSEPVSYHELGMNKLGLGSYTSYVDSCVSTVMKEAYRRFKGWVHVGTVKDAEISYCPINDGVPLHLWRGVVTIAAPPKDVLKRLWKQRHVWDGDVMRPRLVAQIDHQTEVYQYVTRSMTPLTHRDHCILRSWRFDHASSSYVLVATSVSHPSAELQAGIRATELASRYLIEPVDDNNSRLTYIFRVDMKGRSEDYYNTSFGPYLASSVNLVKSSFQTHDFLETPV